MKLEKKQQDFFKIARFLFLSFYLSFYLSIYFILFYILYYLIYCVSV